MHEEVLIIFILINIPIVLFNKKIVKFININDSADGFRKFHKNSVPLFGGILITYNLFVFTFLDHFVDLNPVQIFFNTREYLSFHFGIMLCIFLGLYDDKFNLSPTKKLFFNFCIILFLILLDDSLVIKELSFSFIENQIELKNISYLFTILCVLLFINALNMFDGINLQAGTYCLLIMAIFIIKEVYIFINLIIFFSLILFLIYNFFNKAFLGDSGVQVLAFIVSYTFIKSHNISSSFTPEEIFIILAFPGLDMFRLFLFRILKGRHPFYPDVNHLHHLIAKKKNKLIAYIINFLAIFINIILFYTITNKIIVLSVVLILYVALFLTFKEKSK
tara:strand:- start:2854 stop:3855 length:1002 start_codon:yes stop_codon:yes gene_type:complete